MTDNEISKALALAIGWDNVKVDALGHVWVSMKKVWGARPFDYRDWNVAGPIAEKYDMFPLKEVDHNGYFKCWVVYWSDNLAHKQEADTPQRAIALAVIGANK